MEALAREVDKKARELGGAIVAHRDVFLERGQLLQEAGERPPWRVGYQEALQAALIEAGVANHFEWVVSAVLARPLSGVE
jgi:hypothetical protein